VHEGDEPDALADLGHPDVLSRKDVTQIHLPSLEADPTAGRHGDGLIVKRIGEVLEPPVLRFTLLSRSSSRDRLEPHSGPRSSTRGVIHEYGLAA
jgi:hypothetical protein